MPDPIAVRSMFARIAGRYDILNRGLSLGIDQRWRRRALRRAGEVQGLRVADVCSGTGDLAILFQKAGAQVIGVDFTPEMLVRAARKSAAEGGQPSLFVHGDALALPLEDASVDCTTIAFGIRNVADRARGLRELARITKPGGAVLVLEFTTPRAGLFASAYRFYFTKALPTVGRLVSRDTEAYEYLPRTVLEWPAPEEFESEMRDAGFEDGGFELLTGGIACLHWGRVPAPRLNGKG